MKYRKIALITLLLTACFAIGGAYQKTNATTWAPNHTDDGKVAITPHESIGANNSSYAVSFSLASTTGSTLHGVSYIIYDYFCPDPNTVHGNPNGCIQNGNTSHHGTVNIPTSGVTIGGVAVTPSLANPNFHNCGFYQIDLGLNGGGVSNTHTYQSAGWHDTGVKCIAQMPTPTPTKRPTPTLTPTCTPTPTKTPYYPIPHYFHP